MIESLKISYGKSTLLAQYAASLKAPWAGLRCDASDNHPAGFLAHLHCALGLPLPQPPLSRADMPLLWSDILGYLEQCTQTFTLFVDDLHLLREYGFTRAGEQTSFAQYTYDFSSVGLPGLVFNASYWRGTGINQDSGM